MRSIALLPILPLVILLAGCAGRPTLPPGLTEQVLAAIAAAESAGAADLAPMDLDRARARWDEHEALLARRKSADAARQLKRALLDAELALAKARTAQARESLRRREAEVQKLRESSGGGP